ncbi:MAG: polysaccharide deacetylase family protein [Deltaproteobacteria bacterium]|nr:polysaccharide deacetylase family protein [Deltaproteobacteria bacterium]
MKGIIRIICLACVLAALGAPVHAYVTVLLYHKFDEADSPSTSTPTEMFRQQMDYLKVEGYQVISMDCLFECISGKKPLPEKAVVITIDDGYLSEYTQAVPVLKEHGFPFCIFVFTRAVGSRNYMTWDQLHEVLSSGGDVGSHTHTHPRLTDVPPGEIEKECMVSKRILEEKLGIEAKWFAYPFGEYDDAVRSAGIKAGYRLLLTSDPGSVGPQTKCDLVPRQAIVGHNMNMKRFREKLEQPPLAVAGRSPERGRLESRELKEISITIADPGSYHPGQVQMFLSEKGRLDTHFDPVKGTLVCKETIALTRKVNRIITTARRKSDNLFAMDSYMIVLPE